ncbi:MAG TPA: 50S ribosomal protein L11 methyltransferase [Flavobacteriaceae bacterium]|nr:50S ribosomal protein L11 methyltransferase [Flavobacteriaceae bacterium]
MNYLEFNFKVKPLQPAVEILMAELGNVGFESFVETEKGVLAYIQKKEWNDTLLKDIFILQSNEFKISYTIKEIKQENWNAKWEQSFSPIVVDNICTIRAPFHKETNTLYDIIIEPKMSFGTGHHETTYMMIAHMLQLNFENKSVLDMGCGTGVLAILAEKLGAKKVTAIDIDNWCYENSMENAEKNNCQKITVLEGDATLLGTETYDIILANINRNILIRDLPKYITCLNKNGVLVLSGFYQNDIESIVEVCEKKLLKLTGTREKNKWVSLKFLN